MAKNIGGLLLALAIAGCGGGGGGGGGGAPANGLSVSPASLTFSAADQFAARPASQTITGTVNGFSGGTLFIRIVVSGTAVSSVGNVVLVGSNQGQASVTVADPGTLGPGTHTSTITVTACTTDINCSGALLGSPQTVNVTYQIGQAVISNAIAPAIGPENIAGQVILRGFGFAGTTGVTFGGQPATTFTVVSNTEIHATYPALGAGDYPVEIQRPSGGAFGQTLKLVVPTSYAAGSLAYPAAPQNMRGFVHDAFRQSLIVGLGFADDANRIVRYQFASGNWQPAHQVILTGARDIALTLDGARLLAISRASIEQLDPVSLATVMSAARPTSVQTQADDFLKTLVVANDGNAVVLSSNANFGDLLTYRIQTNAFAPPRCCFYHPQAGGPANGASVLWFESGLSGTDDSLRGHLYSASSGTVGRSNISVQHYHGVPQQAENINPPVFDRSGTRMAVPKIGPEFRVYGGDTLLGILPIATAAYAFSPSGNRAYTLEIDPACRIRGFDASSTSGGTSQLTEVITPITINPADCPASTVGSPIRMLLSPGGETAFIAGNLRIAVVPLP